MDAQRRRLLSGQNPLKPTETHREEAAEDEDDLPLDPPAPSPFASSSLGPLPILEKPPTLSLDTLKGWSSTYKWNDRAAIYDLAWEEEKEAARRAVIEDGFGLDFERLRGMKRLARTLEAMIFETSEVPSSWEIQDSESFKYHNLWMHDVKFAGVGEDVQRVDLVRFNPAIIKEYRALLDEIAKETGGRRPSAQIEAFVKRVLKQIDYNKLTPAQLERITRGEHPVEVLLDQYLATKDD